MIEPIRCEGQPHEILTPCHDPAKVESPTQEEWVNAFVGAIDTLISANAGAAAAYLRHEATGNDLLAQIGLANLVLANYKELVKSITAG